MTEQKWTPWNGGKFLPVDEASIGDVKLRSGVVMRGVKARDVLWGRAKREIADNDNIRNGGEVVAYCFEGEAA